MSERKAAEHCTTFGKRTIVYVTDDGCAYFCTLGKRHKGDHRWAPREASEDWLQTIPSKPRPWYGPVFG